jgi:hypothetical protein
VVVLRPQRYSQAKVVIMRGMASPLLLPPLPVLVAREQRPEREYRPSILRANMERAVANGNLERQLGRVLLHIGD